MEPNMTTVDFIQAVGSWTVDNFQEKQAPLLGIIEEIGEACHCILKRLQGIRGYDNETKFREEIKDCFADATIFLASYASNRNSFFAFKRNLKEFEKTSYPEEVIISHTLQSVCATMNFEQTTLNGSRPAEAEQNVFNVLCQRMLTSLEIWANYRGFDLEEITMETWARVSQRNWKKDTTSGGEVL